MTLFVLILALIWGGAWALFLEYVPLGRWLAAKRTWLTVVVGVGGDLGLLFILIPWETWLLVLGVVALSSIGVIGRALISEMREWHAVMEAQGGTETKRR